MSDRLMAEREAERAARTRYLQGIADRLTDLEPEIRNDTLIVGSLRVWSTTYHFRDVVKVRTSHFRRGGERTYRNTDPAHIAAAVRRIVAERAQANRDAEAWTKQQDAIRAREEAAGREVARRIEYINSTVGGLGLVRNDSVTEITRPDGSYEYRHAFEIDGITEVQALAILDIVRDQALRLESARQSSHEPGCDSWDGKACSCSPYKEAR